jgi:hypothetical protein
MLSIVFKGESVWKSRAALYLPVVRQMTDYATGGAIFVFCVLAATLLMKQVSLLFLIDEVGAGDSYVLYDVQQFSKSGIIYRDLSQPPYTPSVYSPALYIFYSIPGRLVAWENPFLGPRLLALAAFLLCIAVTVSLTRALITVRYAWVWGLLLAGSIVSMDFWVLQIRGDFPAIFFSLAAIRLLLSESPRAVPLAGVCAGLATQFKFTLVAALVAGCLWLLARRLWRDLARFAAAGFVASAGLYFTYWLREPRMLSHLASLSIGVVDVKGCLDLIRAVLTEAVVLLALAAIPPSASRVSPRWTLLGLFAIISFTIASLANLHPGGNLNYFYEALFAVVPAASLGVIRLTESTRRHIPTGLFVAALFFLHYAHPERTHGALSRGEIGFRSVAVRNAEFERIQEALRGQHIFSTVERLALLDPTPALVNVFNFWAINPQYIYKRLSRSEFDVVITPSHAVTWRGIDFIKPRLRDAIGEAYTPHCVIGELAVQGPLLLHLPRNRRTSDAFLQQLSRAGCVPVTDTPGSAGTTW